MLCLTSSVGLLCLGAAAPLIPTSPSGVGSSIQVGYVSYPERIPQILEQTSPQFERYTKRSESTTESGDSVDEPVALPKGSKPTTETGEPVEEPGALPKRFEPKTETGDSVDEPGALPK